MSIARQAAMEKNKARRRRTAESGGSFIAGFVEMMAVFMIFLCKGIPATVFPADEEVLLPPEAETRIETRHESVDFFAATGWPVKIWPA